MKTLLLLSLFMWGCAKATVATSSQAPKGLHSEWTSASPNWKMDFTSPTEVVWTYPDGGTCKSTASIDWQINEDSGLLIITNSLDQTRVSNNDPSCAQFNGTWDYNVLASGVLELCDQTGCVEFK